MEWTQRTDYHTTSFLRPVSGSACPFLHCQAANWKLHPASTTRAASMAFSRAHTYAAFAGCGRHTARGLNAQRYPDALSPQGTPSRRRHQGGWWCECLSSAVVKHSSTSYDWWASHPQFPSCLSLHSTARWYHGTWWEKIYTQA